MRQELNSVAAMLAGSASSEMKRVKRLVLAPSLAILVAACTLPADRAVRAYDACMSRHPQGAALCEGPLQAYELDMSRYQATAAISPPGASSTEDLATGIR